MKKMIEFNISAPGRIILSGDHAAMYEKCVVMASLDRRTTLKFCELPDEQGIIKIEFPKVNISLDIPLEIVQKNFSNIDMQAMTLNNIRLLRYVKQFITLNGMWSTHEQKFSLQIFFLLLYSIADKEKFEIRSFRVYVFTDLPIGGGLGSSTSFAVCIAACFIHWAGLQKGAHDEFDMIDLGKIWRYTILYEEYMQDYMIGFDNKMCTYGKIQYFQYVNSEDCDYRILDVPRMKILLIDSNISQNNREWLERMADLKYTFPVHADSLLHRIYVISKKIWGKLSEIVDSHINPNSLQLQKNAYDQLQKYIQENQRILHKSKLSHPTLDNICSIAQSCGFAGKLTGFGGGFVYILLPPSTQEEQMTNLSTQLEAEGFNVTKTSVSCSGVRIDD